MLATVRFKPILYALVNDSHQTEQRTSPMSEDKKIQDLTVESPPTTTWGIVRCLGPGLIVAGSIVGSGELIATTTTGAQAGFSLLWLILIGCVIKVFVQVEMGRHAIVTGKTTMAGLDEVPGPRIKGRGNWMIWYWFIMFLASIAQLGGIVGGVGQALSISAPVTQYGAAYNQYAEAETQLIVKHKEISRSLAELDRLNAEGGSASTEIDAIQKKISDDRRTVVKLEIQDAEYRVILNEIFAASLENANDKDSKETREQALAENEVLDQLVTALAPIDAALQANPDVSSGSLEDARIQLIVDLYRAKQLQEQISANSKSLEDSSSNGADSDKVGELRERASELAGQFERLRSELIKSGEDAQLASIVDEYVEVKSFSKAKPPIDDKIWAGIVTAITVVILFNGRFGLIQSFSTALVALFTMITLVNLALLQSNPTWGVSLADIAGGLRFRFADDPSKGATALSTALKTFGIIGVGASELVTYPYWCLEKGYARYTGERDGSSAWLERARGWLRVMRWDAWCSMFVYTFATCAFYLLGAAILGRTGLEPEGTEMIRYLSVMYEPVFGVVAQAMFLFGAFAVLYSTFFVANASHARVFSDAIRVMGLVTTDEKSYRRRVQYLSALFPILCFVIYCFIPKPTQLVLLSGLMQAMMLPMLSGAALFFRYRGTIPELRPHLIWDIFLWISAFGMLVAGCWAGWSEVSKWM